jgi:hypothetical protein
MRRQFTDMHVMLEELRKKVESGYEIISADDPMSLMLGWMVSTDDPNEYEHWWIRVGDVKGHLNPKEFNLIDHTTKRVRLFSEFKPVEIPSFWL